MKKLGMTIIETLLGVTFVAIISGCILGLLITVQRYFLNGIAIANSCATARDVIEKIVRWNIREASGFSITNDGNTLTIDKKDGSSIVFNFEDEDEEITKDDEVIGSNVIKYDDRDIFEEIKKDELVGINFGIRNEGVKDNYKKVYISTVIKLRN